MKIRGIARLIAWILALAPGFGAWAETRNCTAITTLPYTINVQGVYCFTGHLGTSITAGSAITIATNNVTIDMNGYKLGGLAAGRATAANGISALRRKNISIRNGTVRGFYVGIRLDDAPPDPSSQGHLVEDIRADGNTYAGIWVSGRGNTLRRNRIVDTGGSSFTPNSVGMFVAGPGNDVMDNSVTTTTARDVAYAHGLFLSEADGSLIRGNRVTETLKAGGLSFGIYVSASAGVHLVDNAIISADRGIEFNSSTGKYRDNLTENVGLAYVGGTPSGGGND